MEGARQTEDVDASVCNKRDNHHLGKQRKELAKGGDGSQLWKVPDRLKMWMRPHATRETTIISESSERNWRREETEANYGRCPTDRRCGCARMQQERQPSSRKAAKEL
jgi:hypothetical protein